MKQLDNYEIIDAMIMQTYLVLQSGYYPYARRTLFSLLRKYSSSNIEVGKSNYRSWKKDTVAMGGYSMPYDEWVGYLLADNVDEISHPYQMAGELARKFNLTHTRAWLDYGFSGTPSDYDLAQYMVEQYNRYTRLLKGVPFAKIFE